MRRLLSPGARRALVFCGALFLAERLLERAGLAPSFLRAWLDDGLVLPLALGAALVLHRVTGRSSGWTLPTAHTAAALLLITVGFEVVLPLLDARATADPADAVAYAGGAGFFLMLINRPAAEAR